MTDDKSDDSKLFGMTPAAWVVIIGCFASSLMLPAWNSYWTSKHDFELKALQLKLESVNKKTEDNASKHDALVSEIHESGAAMAMRSKATTEDEVKKASETPELGEPEPVSPK